MRLHHVALACSSPERAERFYHDILGLSKIKTFRLSKELSEQIFEISHEYEMITYGSDLFIIELFITPPSKIEVGVVNHFCLQVDDREELLKKCESVGLEVKRIKKEDSIVTFIKDFDGNLIEIKES